MTRLYNFINEGRSKELTERSAHDTIKLKCMDALKGQQIFRGNINLVADYYITDPSQYDARISPYASTNSYNLLLSNLPSWSKYPKRNKSLVCTTDFKTACEGYGKGSAYVVLPFDGSDIGVCPTSDIWDSFTKVIGDYFLNHVNHIIFDLAEMVGFGGRIFSYGNLVAIFNKVDGIHRDDASQNIEIFSKRVFDFLDNVGYFKNDKTPLIDCVNKAMSPENNGFKLVRAGSNTLSTNKEVWTDGPCVLVQNEVYNKIRHNLL